MTPRHATLAHAPVVLDIAATALNADDRRRLKHPLVGGLILFARHWEHRRQLTDLVAQIKDIRPDLLVCVDHEGGRVQRFRTDGFTSLPAMRRLGELWMRDAMKASLRASVRAGEAKTGKFHHSNKNSRQSVSVVIPRKRAARAKSSDFL